MTLTRIAAAAAVCGAVLFVSACGGTTPASGVPVVGAPTGTPEAGVVPPQALTNSTAPHTAAPAAILVRVMSATHFSRRRWGQVGRRGWRDRPRPRCR